MLQILLEHEAKMDPVTRYYQKLEAKKRDSYMTYELISEENKSFRCHKESGGVLMDNTESSVSLADVNHLHSGDLFKVKRLD